MKKTTFKILAVCAAMLILMSALCSCSRKLNGTYVSKELISQTFEFTGDTVKMSAFGIDISGTYKIEGKTLTITYTLLGLSYDKDYTFDKKGNSIFVDGTEFVKQ